VLAALRATAVVRRKYTPYQPDKSNYDNQYFDG
jgi:hypothetical protein